jgi:hypothetical protein
VCEREGERGGEGERERASEMEGERERERERERESERASEREGERERERERGREGSERERERENGPRARDVRDATYEIEASEPGRADGKQLCCRFRPVLAELRPVLAGDSFALHRPLYSLSEPALAEPRPVPHKAPQQP